jgi:hypothetical protein
MNKSSFEMGPGGSIPILGFSDFLTFSNLFSTFKCVEILLETKDFH